MDLGAYAQINDLGKLAEANGIDVPRLRGYRLMSDEKPVSREEIKKMMENAAIREVKYLCDAEPFWSTHPKWHTYSSYTDYVEKYLAKITLGFAGKEIAVRAISIETGE